MSTVDPQTFEKLNSITGTEWVVIFKELVLYGELRLTKIGFKPRTELDVKNGEDFATDAIQKVFEGTRAWDVNLYPDLLIHLKGVVKSLIWNHVKTSSKSVVKKGSVTSIIDNAEEMESSTDFVTSEDPEEIFISEENWTEFEQQFEDDDDGFIMFCDWFDGIRPRDIAKKYSVDITIVYNTIKKGKRIITKIFTS